MTNTERNQLKRLIIIGASGFGREVAWLVERINDKEKTWQLMGFLDDNPDIQGKAVNEYKVLGTTDDVNKYPDAYYVCAVGASKTREKIIGRVLQILPKAQFATLIDPSAEYSNFVSFGKGSIICAHTIITVNVEIGEHVIINLDCTVGHDAVIKDFATLYPSVNVSGASEVGRGAELGTGTQIIQCKRIEDYTIVGAGATIIRDIEDSGVYVGVPAKKIK